MSQPALQSSVNPSVEAQAQMRIVIVGHVDHGKSTLVGRLLHDTDSLSDGKFDAIKASCDKRGMPFEWSFLLDALQAERDQAITIDTTQIWFNSALRRYNIIDAPGHREFLKNMITGAASAEAAMLVIDADEGVKEQSKRHGYLLHMLGIRQIIVAVNKMDLVQYDQTRFETIEAEYRAYLSDIGVTPTHVIPVSGRQGDNIAAQSDAMPWYTGPSVVCALDEFVCIPQSDTLPLRMNVQDVYKFDARRIIAGRIESGRVKVGDELIFAPGNLKGTVETIEQWPNVEPARGEASVGESVGITLEEQIFVERGQIGCHAQNLPLVTDQIRARVFWLSSNPLLPGERYKVKIGTAELMAEVKQVVQVLDTNDLAHSKQEQVEKNQVAEIIFRIRGKIACDDYAALPATGRFVLLDGYTIAGGGIIYYDGDTELVPERSHVKSENIYTEDYLITTEDRKRLNGHTGGVLWFTGLSGSGKSTLAKELQTQLFHKGYQVYVLDGDNVRHGLCSDLGFSADDRAENIRRVGEVASLFADAGFIVITAFISPSQEDRRRARASTEHYFNIVHIDADLEACEKRDVKGLYKKARAGEIKEFTGISAPYEPPEQADLVVDTVKYSVQECVSQLLEYIETTYC